MTNKLILAYTKLIFVGTGITRFWNSTPHIYIHESMYEFMVWNCAFLSYAISMCRDTCTLIYTTFVYDL